MEKEKVWTEEIKMQHPKKWILMTHLEYDGSGKNVLIGYVHVVCDAWEEAFEIEKSFGDTMGRTALFKGFDDTPQIGGLFLTC